MPNWVKKVADFHRAFLHPVPELHRGLDYLDTQDGLTNIRLRKSLITEEYTELMSGLVQAEAQAYCSLPITQEVKEEILSRISKRLNINKKEAKYFLSISSIENNMYKKEDDSIEIIYKDGSTRDIAKASDMLNISLLSRKVKKYYICYLRSENDGH